MARLPEYLRLLTEVFDQGIPNLSSEELADLAGVNAAKVRKDLSYLGSYGVGTALRCQAVALLKID